MTAHPGEETPKVFIHVISDATGTAAERMARAALVQFHRRFSAIFVRHPFVKTTRQLEDILAHAREQDGVVIYTINDRELRQWLAAREVKNDAVVIDMLGPLFERISQRYGSQPLLDSNLLGHALGEQSLKLAESIEFTLRHDDGKGLATLGQAEVILLGVSRTSKTPTSLYLSCHHNLKVANVPLILDQDPPAKLLRLRKPKMVGLTIEPAKLAAIRRGRYGEQTVPGYSDPRAINTELAFAEEVFSRIKGIKVIDVTDRPIEEVASLIV